jgi:tetratricopeptide (TPR) repeat protein
MTDKDFSYALETALKRVEAAPESDEALADLAYTYYRLSNYYEALNNFNKALVYNSDDFQSYFFRGLTYSEIGSHNLALADFDRGIELNPEYAEFYENRAKIYDKLGDGAKARADRRKYEELSKMQ